jgi:hypothetical protein
MASPRKPKARATATAGATSSPSADDPGERACRFLNRLTHTGDYSGQPFALRPWQEGPIRRLFGTLRPDGTRRYRKTFWALPRKQGKTEIVAGASLLLLMGQGRANQRIYTASGDTEQAALIFGAACEMIRNDPALEARTVIYDGYKRIDFPAGNSSLKVLSSVPEVEARPRPDRRPDRRVPRRRRGAGQRPDDRLRRAEGPADVDDHHRRVGPDEPLL